MSHVFCFVFVVFCVCTVVLVVAASCCPSVDLTVLLFHGCKAVRVVCLLGSEQNQQRTLTVSLNKNRKQKPVSALCPF